MIGTLEIKVAAHSPNIPLKKVFSFVNSPSNIRVIDVPKKIGQWQIQKVYVSFRYPNNTVVSKEAKLIAGCWTATLSGSPISGESKNGVIISADGKDENGNSINGYVLGVGDITILKLDGSITPGIINYYLRLLDEEPENPNKGDVLNDGSEYKLYDGENWQSFCDINLEDYYTKEDIDTLLSDKADVSSVYSKSQIEQRENTLSGQLTAQIPTNVSQLNNDSGYITNNALTSYSTTTQMNTAIFNATDPIQSAVDEMYISLGSIDAKIPEQATSENQLADKNFVNSSITTATAFFKGTYNSVAELPTTDVTPNDYAFVIRTDAVGQTFYDRYKYNGTTWLFEYSINNSGFTSTQYAAINSGVTASDVEQIWTNAGTLTIKANTGDVYTRDELYTQTEVDNLLYPKANSNDVYTKQETNSLLTSKANVSSVYAKSDLSSFVLSGEYEDSTTFSFNVLYKL